MLPPPRSPRPYTLFPYAALFRAASARRPGAIAAAEAVSAAATDTYPVSIAAPNSAAITKCRIAPSYPSRPAAGGRGRERDLERNASFDADDARQIGRASCRERVCQYV